VQHHIEFNEELKTIDNEEYLILEERSCVSKFCNYIHSGDTADAMIAKYKDKLV